MESIINGIRNCIYRIFKFKYKPVILILFAYLNSCGLLESNPIKEGGVLFDNYILAYNKVDNSSGLQLFEKINNESSQILLSNCNKIYYNDTIAYIKYFKYVNKKDSIFGYGILKKKKKQIAGNDAITEIDENEFMKSVQLKSLKPFTIALTFSSQH